METADSSQRVVRWSYWVAILVVSGVLLLLALGFAAWALGWFGKEQPKFTNVGPTIMHVERIGELSVLRVNVTDVLEGTANGHKGSWIIVGDAVLTVDLRKARFSDIDEERRTISIELPDVEVKSPRVDHNRSKTYDVQKATWLPWRWGDRDELQDKAMRQAQRLVENAANGSQMRADARENCERMIQAMFAGIEWTVHCKWPGGTVEPASPTAESTAN